MMASMMASPRKGHLEQLFHIFGYLKQRYNCEMVFNPTLPDFDETVFQDEIGNILPTVEQKSLSQQTLLKNAVWVRLFCSTVGSTFPIFILEYSFIKVRWCGIENHLTVISLLQISKDMEQLF